MPVNALSMTASLKGAFQNLGQLAPSEEVAAQKKEAGVPGPGFSKEGGEQCISLY